MTTWWEQQRYLIDYTLASLLRRKWRNLGLISAYTLVVFALASVMLLSHSLREEAKELLAAAPEVTLQRMVMGRHDLIRGEEIEKVKGIRGTRNVEGRLWGYFFDTFTNATFTVMVPSRFQKEIQVADGEAIIGEGVAALRKVGKGDILMFASPESKVFFLEVKEVLPDESSLVTSDLIFLSEHFFRQFFALPEGLYTDIAISVRNSREVPKVQEKLAWKFVDGRVIGRDDLLRTYAAVFDWREGILLTMLSLSLLAFGLLAWDKASGLSGTEKREIGILKAVGWDTTDVMKMKFWEGALVSATAFLVGYLGAYLHVFYFSAGLLEPVLKGWSLLYPRFQLTPRVDELQLMSLFFLTVVPYCAATMVPVWRTATMDPDTVMRG